MTYKKEYWDFVNKMHEATKATVMCLKRPKIKSQSPYDYDLIYDNSGGDLSDTGTEEEDLKRNDREIFD